MGKKGTKLWGNSKNRMAATGWALCLWNCPMNSERKNDMCKVLSDYTRKMGTGLCSKKTSCKTVHFTN
jgi:hypothetical protein